MSEFRDMLRQAIVSLSCPQYEDIEKAAKGVLDELAEQGVVKFREDYRLGGGPLETRVMLILAEMGFTVARGREGLEDFVIQPPNGSAYPRPLVLEVKSGKDAGPTREHLRQLDDWVFDLSGEEVLRRGPVGGGGLIGGGHRGGSRVIQTNRSVWHPTPHKGVFIYNGPLGIQFSGRSANWLGANEEAFASKRNFCVIAFSTLLAYHAKTQADSAYKHVFWERVHATAGVLQPLE